MKYLITLIIISHLSSCSSTEPLFSEKEMQNELNNSIVDDFHEGDTTNLEYDIYLVN